jgi:aminoglycoside 6'-N-acetyltransferase
MCGTAVSQSVAMNRATEPEVTFRPLEEWDFPILSAWFAEPHVRRFYQKTYVAAEYGPCVRADETGICHFAIIAGTRFAYLHCYRNADYPEWRRLIGVDGGISVDLFIGDPAYLRKGLGRAALSGYLKRIAFPFLSTEARAYIAHERLNTAALRCSRAAGFLPLRGFREDGAEMVLLAMNTEELRSTYSAA